MSNDIFLDDDFIKVQGFLKVSDGDVVVDRPERRAPGPEGPQEMRRALVHNPQDGLTINWAGDYPDGVAINGKVHMNDAVTIDGDIHIELFKPRPPAPAGDPTTTAGDPTTTVLNRMTIDKTDLPRVDPGISQQQINVNYPFDAVRKAVTSGHPASRIPNVRVPTLRLGTRSREPSLNPPAASGSEAC